MTVTVALSSELIAALRALAGRTGRDLSSTIAGVVEEQVQKHAAEDLLPPHVPQAEADLLERIQRGLPEATWQRYDELQELRELEQLTPDQHRELIALTDEIEGWNVRRLQLAKQLADLRGVPWQKVVQELQLSSSVRG